MRIKHISSTRSSGHLIEIIYAEHFLFTINSIFGSKMGYFAWPINNARISQSILEVES